MMLLLPAFTPADAHADGAVLSTTGASAEAPHASASLPSDAGTTTPSSAGQAKKPADTTTLRSRAEEPRASTVTADAPLLTKQSNGTYMYRGRGFDAVVDADGSVHMHDVFVRARFALKPIHTLTDEVRVGFFEVRYDIMGWLERKLGKSDPYRSERRWFFERTYGLREQLAFRAVAEKMQKELNALWSQAGLDFAERKRRTFALWDESSEDEFGDLCRARVVDFVRMRCPQSTMLGFSGEELRVLNAARRSRALFSPYSEAARVAE